MRLINADELKKEIERIKQNVEEWVNHTDCDITRALVKISLFEEFIDLIDNAPTVLERPQGEWLSIGYGYYCSICHNYHENSNFCPECGADMRGANNGKEETT